MSTSRWGEELVGDIDNPSTHMYTAYGIRMIYATVGSEYMLMIPGELRDCKFEHGPVEIVDLPMNTW